MAATVSFGRGVGSFAVSQSKSLFSSQQARILTNFKRYCSSGLTGELSEEELSFQYQRGLPVIAVPLPSRDERCQFTLKPVSHSVGDLCDFIIQEDRGVDFVALYNTDGTRIASSTPIEHLLLLGDFRLRINDKSYSARTPALPLEGAAAAISGETREPVAVSAELMKDFGDVKSQIGTLFTVLNVDEHQLKSEERLLKKLEDLKLELAPLEEERRRLAARAERRTSQLCWLGLSAMGLQFGTFARLTWWEYSWDIMEPVTYFATYSVAIGCFAYFLLTRQNYEYPEARDRLFLGRFYKQSKKAGFDVGKYNELKRAIWEAERDLSRLRDPLFLHLPRSRIQSLQRNKLPS